MSECGEGCSVADIKPINCCSEPPHKGLTLLPLRYGAIGAENLGDISSLPDLGSNLGDKVKDKPLTHSKYTTRLLRTGYLYTLEDRKGVLRWCGYLITARAQLFQFDIDESAPPVNEAYHYTCIDCADSAVTVTIPRAEEVPNFYLLYSRDPLSHEKLDEYKQHAAGYAAVGKMQVIHPNSSGITHHMVTPTNLANHVLEFYLYEQYARGADIFAIPPAEVLKNQLFPPMVYTESTLPDKKSKTQTPTLPAQFKLLGRTRDKLIHDKGVGVVLFDPIGITQELNNFRNDAVSLIHEFMEKPDANQPGVTNERKFLVHNKIEEVQATLAQAMCEKHYATIEELKELRQGHMDYIDENESTAGSDGILLGRLHQARTYRDNLNVSIPELETKNIDAEAKKEWQDKYGSKIAPGEREKFMDNLKTQEKKALQLVIERADDHLKWLKSDQLVGAFDTYYPGTPSEALGKAFSIDAMGFVAEADLCFYGIDGIEKYNDLLKSWLAPKPIKPKNLFLRSFCYNHKDIEAHLEKAFPAVLALAGKVTNATQIKGPDFQQAFKAFFADMAKINPSVEAWYGSQPKGKSTAGRLLDIHLQFKMRMVAHAVLGKENASGEHSTPKESTLDKNKVATLGGLIYSKLHELHEEVSFGELLFRIVGKEKKDIHNEVEEAEAKKHHELRHVEGELPIKSFESWKVFQEKETAAVEKLIEGARKNELPHLEAELQRLIDEKIKNIPPRIQKKGIKAYEKEIAWQKIKARDTLTKTAEFNTIKNKIEHAHGKMMSHETGVTRGAIGLALFDVIALANMGFHFEDEKAKWAFAATALQLVSAVATILDNNLRKMGHAGHAGAYLTTKQAAASGVEKLLTEPKVHNGGLKLAAGQLMMGAAIATVVFSRLEFIHEKHKIDADPVLLTLYFGNGFVSGGAALCYGVISVGESATWLGTTSVGKRLLLAEVAEGAAWLTKALILGRLLVMFNVAGLIITVLQVLYMVLKDDELQHWLAKSTYRRYKWGGHGATPTAHYQDAEEELDAFSEAVAEVLGIKTVEKPKTPTQEQQEYLDRASNAWS